MKLAMFDLSRISLNEQAVKVCDEYVEWKNIDDFIMADLEESIDVIQAMYGYIQKKATPEQIAEAFAAHEAKMRRYEAIGRVPKILGWVELKEAE